MTSLPEYCQFSAEVCHSFDCNRRESELQGIGSDMGDVRVLKSAIEALFGNRTHVHNGFRSGTQLHKSFSRERTLIVKRPQYRPMENAQDGLNLFWSRLLSRRFEP